MAINDKNILTIGCPYKHPKGGIAQVLYNYDKYIFNDFNCIVNSVEGPAILKFLKLFSAVILFLLKNIFNRNIKIVHIHTASNNSFRRSAIFISLAKMFGKKVVLHIHGGGFREYYQTNPSYVTGILDNCDCIIALTEAWRKYFQTITGCKMIEVVGNLIPEPVITAKQRDGKIHLLFLGLISRAKGIFDLLDILEVHRKEFESKLLLHVGGNGDVEQLQASVREKNLTNMVIYEGWVSGERKTDLMNLSDAFILPSYVEGLPLSVLEAMSYGLPILATSVGGIPEIVENNLNGILFPPGDKNSILCSILRIMNDLNLRKTMGEYSKNIVKDYYPNSVVLKLEKIYESLLVKE